MTSTTEDSAEPLIGWVVDCAVYVDGERLPGEYGCADAITEVRRRRDGFVWIGLYEPDREQMQGIAGTFGLHELAVEDAVHAHQRPKLDRYGDALFMVFKTVRYVEHESPTTANEIVESGDLMAFLGKDFIVTVRHGDHSGLGELRRQLEAEPRRLRAGPSIVLHAIASRAVDTYVRVSESFEGDIDVIEAGVFAPRSPIGAEHMYLMKREILELQVRSYFRESTTTSPP